jgi:hypothetical protein
MLVCRPGKNHVLCRGSESGVRAFEKLIIFLTRFLGEWLEVRSENGLLTISRCTADFSFTIKLKKVCVDVEKAKAIHIEPYRIAVNESGVAVVTILAKRYIVEKTMGME